MSVRLPLGRVAWRHQAAMPGLVMSQLFRQLIKKSIAGYIRLNEIYGERDGAASFDAVNVELLLAAPVANGIRDDGNVHVIE
ncbi:hypothetical protein ATY76_19760 [Rhizobium sp. R339]|nr:hypothetical protein ATY76_19760 [Rhizobium sp. R339]